MDPVTQTAVAERIAGNLQEIGAALGMIAGVLLAVWKAWEANRMRGSLAGLVAAVEAGTSALPQTLREQAKDQIRKTLSEKGVYREVDAVVQKVVHGGEAPKPHTHHEIKVPEAP